MKKFYFQAVTEEGKQISGYISANTQEEAHDKMKESKLSILTLEERAISIHKEGVSVFTFEALNTQKKTVKGTIESVDMYSAYKKLKYNYKFEILFLAPDGISDEEKEKLRKIGIDPAFEKRLNAELKIALRKEKKSKKITIKEDEIDEVLKYHQEEIGFIRDNIDEVLQEVVPLLEENIDYIDPIKYREIEEKIDLLLRLKHSNSVDHLKNLTQRLLDELVSDQMFLHDASLPVEMQEEIERRRAQFLGVNDKFSKAILTGILDLQNKFADLSVEDIKEKIASLRILNKFRGLILSTFFSLFIICVVFWLFVSFEYFQEINVDRALFYFSSPLLWFLTGLAGLCSLWFFVLGFKKLSSVKNQLIILGLGCLGVLIFFIQFPVFFFWTGLN
jgi:hypothetical protein